MPRKTGASIAKKWGTNTVRGTDNMRAGVEAVTEAPGEKAAAAEDRWAEGVRRAKESGKFANNVRSVSLGTWKDRMVKKGIPRVADGVAAASPLVQAFHDQHQPLAEQSSENAKAAKAAGVDGRQRMLANYDMMSGFRFQRPRS